MALTLGALGVVYGDIGTSPLYALRESFHGHHLPASPENVLGILSLIFWALVLVISVKYCTFVLRADNEGEGGILTLAGLSVRLRGRLRGRRWLVVPLGLFGVALLYGDGTITPAISVLSAVEGLEVLAPATKPYVIPITLAILAGLFAVQKRAMAPEMPVSISSNTRIGMRSALARTVLSASITRDTSPPEATRTSGRGSSPRLVER